MQRFIAALAFGLAFAGAAHADPLESAYGNTVVVTLESGASLRYLYNADNSFTLIAPDGSEHAGTWAIENSQLCMTSQALGRSCTPLGPERSVGDTWQATAGDGSTVTLTLQRGR
ncbi:MAG: hypothetical protein NVV62_17885 [Terricaulis sp.]|nr:hypothetical protein [Terricaulis sp.]